jgi:hypothetical protein
MTHDEVLAQVRAVQPGEYTDEQAKRMIDDCDQRIYRELLDGYIVPETGGELVAPVPYDALYKWWTLANIALMQQDVASYNNWMQMFNSLWDEYGRMVSRTYKREKQSKYLL